MSCYSKMVQWMVTLILTMLLIGPVCIAQDPWHFEDFCNIFLPNVGERPNKVLPSELGASGTVPYGKSGPGYSITSIKRLDSA